MMHMEPIIAPLVSNETLSLGNLIGVMRESIIDTAAVDIQILAQVLQRNTGALNMPTGITNAPGRIPLQRLIFKFTLGKPKDKVILIALICILVNAFTNADGQIILIVIVENIILVQSGSIKVYITTGNVCLTLFNQAFNHGNELRNTTSCRLNHIRLLDVQFLTISKECISIVLCNFHDRLIFTLCALEHLILASICIGSQVTNVGDVHNTLNIITNITQSLFKDVFHNVGTQITNVCKMVDRRSTCIHFHHIRGIRLKQFFLVRQ